MELLTTPKKIYKNFFLNFKLTLLTICMNSHQKTKKIKSICFTRSRFQWVFKNIMIYFIVIGIFSFIDYETNLLQFFLRFFNTLSNLPNLIHLQLYTACVRRCKNRSLTRLRVFYNTLRAPKAHSAKWKKEWMSDFRSLESERHWVDWTTFYARWKKRGKTYEYSDRADSHFQGQT